MLINPSLAKQLFIFTLIADFQVPLVCFRSKVEVIKFSKDHFLLQKNQEDFQQGSGLEVKTCSSRFLTPTPSTYTSLPLDGAARE